MGDSLLTQTRKPFQRTVIRSLRLAIVIALSTSASACLKAHHSPAHTLETQSQSRTQLALLSPEAEPVVQTLPAVKLKRECGLPGGPTPKGRKAIYEFDALPIEPLDFGPRIADKRRHGLPVTVEEISRRLAGYEQVLKACYRWARYEHPSLGELVELRFELDPFGMASKVSVLPQTLDGKSLAACINDVLQGFSIDRRTLRRTQATVPLRFKLSGQSMPARRPSRPKSSHSTAQLPQGVCISIPENLAVDVLSPTSPVFTVNDFDQEQADSEEDQRRKEDHAKAVQKCRARAKRTGSGCIPPRLGQRPRIVAGRVVAPCCLNKSYYLHAVKENMGAYRLCYHDAVRRGLTKDGLVVVHGNIDKGGNLKATITSSTLSDQELLNCIRQAFDEIWYYPLPRSNAPCAYDEVAITVPLKMSYREPLAHHVQAHPVRATVKAIEQLALTALKMGNGNKALRHYSALLRQRPEDRRSCLWHLGILESLLQAYPWVDERIIDAANRLIRSVAASTEDFSKTECLAKAAPVLMRLATEPHRDSQRFGLMHLKSIAVERYRWLLSLKPSLPNECELRYFLSEALFSLDRFSEADQVFGPSWNRGATGHWYDTSRAVDNCKRQMREGNKQGVHREN